MSTKGKYTTLYDIIERTRRSGIEDFTEEEAKEWVWEVISLLGIPASLVSKVAVIQVEHARAELPYDLSDISEGGIRDFHSKQVLIKEGNIFHDSDKVGVDSSATNLSFEGQSVVYVNGVPTDLGDGFLVEIPKRTYDRQSYTYRINNGFIETGFKDGLIELAYKAFPVDNENNPMIEHSAKLIRVVVAYISMKVINRMWLRDEVTERKKVSFETDYSFAAAAARSDANLGSIDDWEAVRARMNRIYRDPGLHKVGFQGYSNDERINLG